MVRLSKKSERTGRSPRRPKIGGVKTGAKKDNLPKGFREQANAQEGELAKTTFIPKI